MLADWVEASVYERGDDLFKSRLARSDFPSSTWLVLTNVKFVAGPS